MSEPESESIEVTLPFSGLAEWTIRRNPMYLISAALMAIGARLFLVDPHDAAGDVQLILITLLAVQVYEWMVGGILIALHRANRSPEDKPSLMLVATLFWTGPMAATFEMISVDLETGTGLAAAACVIAIGELRTVCRLLDLRVTIFSQLVGVACVLLLAVTAPLVKMPVTINGNNELRLYGAWWLLALIGLLAVGSARAWQRRVRAGGDNPTAGLTQDVTFLVLTIGVTAAHLVGINYGFFCNASLFYASPLLLAVAIGSAEFLLLTKPRWSLAYIGSLPAMAIGLVFDPFHEAVPVERLPTWLRDPAVLVSFGASVTWWFIYLRHRTGVFLHAGSAAAVLALMKLPNETALIPSMTAPESAWITIAYGVVAYLLLMAAIRRSRTELVAAIVANFAATALLVSNKTPMDEFILSLLGGWSVLAIIHLAHPRAGVCLRLAPISWLSIVPWICDFAPSLRWPAGVHAVAMISILSLAGMLWPQTRYRATAAALLTVHLAFPAGHWILTSSQAVPTLFVVSAFVLLAGGATLSWHKSRLLASFEEAGQRIEEKEPDVE